MSTSAAIVGKELILIDWQVLAVCGGINFETGGTMNVAVYFDPELGPELQMSQPSADDYRKYVSDPEMIALLMKRSQPRVRRSPHTRQILALDFASRDHDPYFDWVLDQKPDVLLPKAIKAVEKMGRPQSDATAFLAELLSVLGQLDDWGEVNRRRFSGYRLLVDAELTEELSLTSESVANHDGDYVSIYSRDFA